MNWLIRSTLALGLIIGAAAGTEVVHRTKQTSQGTNHVANDPDDIEPDNFFFICMAICAAAGIGTISSALMMMKTTKEQRAAEQKILADIARMQPDGNLASLFSDDNMAKLEALLEVEFKKMAKADSPQHSR